ncbi:DUF2199 domain-containing protein [Lentzea sp. HUAS12]|uniref:DUF2199 domain-containing protein n=1 Tax=Lentzea sp. HUAS12 TaxID=2951806 RepID=UPI00209E35A4|nr:DUF2199 domain-containing protein [Lentzea sp. HUAS12]USX55381.1 DUF2199 domain-containing protein [Lentzea sp. HUAS12]
MTACDCCGAEVDDSGAIDLDLGLPPGVRTPSLRAGGNVLLADDAAYVRCVLPVELTCDLELWFGAWMRVDPEAARHAAEVWDGPGYATLRFTGTFAHDLKPWDDLRGVPVVAEVREPDDLPEYVQHPVLGRVWDRDEVLSGYLVELPISIRQKLPGTWSIERTAGLTPHVLEEGLRFAGPGRAVFVDVRRAMGTPAEQFLEMALEGAPDVPAEQQFLVRDGVELRHALWLTTTSDGVTRHEFHGHVARFGEMLVVTCVHDDPADHAWARHVLNSVRFRRVTRS